MEDHSFAKEMYERPLFFDLRGLQALFSERMEELGIRKKIKEAVETAGFLPYLKGECEKRVLKILMEPWNGMEELMAFTTFLFGKYSVLEEKAQRCPGELEEPFADVISGRFPANVRVREAGVSEVRDLRKEFPYPSVFARSGLRLSVL